VERAPPLSDGIPHGVPIHARDSAGRPLFTGDVVAIGLRTVMIRVHHGEVVGLDKRELPRCTLVRRWDDHAGSGST
jgi:hypothetical protein